MAAVVAAASPSRAATPIAARISFARVAAPAVVEVPELISPQ
jgi:hypothetical protein